MATKSRCQRPKPLLISKPTPPDIREVDRDRELFLKYAGVFGAGEEALSNSPSFAHMDDLVLKTLISYWKMNKRSPTLAFLGIEMRLNRHTVADSMARLVKTQRVIRADNKYVPVMEKNG